MFVRITNQHKFGAFVCLNLVTQISRQLLLQSTNGLLHLGCIISEQHPYQFDTFFYNTVRFLSILQPILHLNMNFSTTSTSISNRSFVVWSHHSRAAPQVFGISILWLVCARWDIGDYIIVMSMLEMYGWGCRMHRRRTDQSYGIRWREWNTEKGAESVERNEERGEMRNIYRRGERLGLSLCAVPSPRRI